MLDVDVGFLSIYAKFRICFMTIKQDLDNASIPGSLRYLVFVNFLLISVLQPHFISVNEQATVLVSKSYIVDSLHLLGCFVYIKFLPVRQIGNRLYSSRKLGSTHIIYIS